MRLDQFLKLTRILKQRTLAKQACDAGSVTVNGEAAKPGTLLRVGDRLRVDIPAFELEAEVLEVPQTTNVPRKSVERYISILSRQSRDPRTYVFGDNDEAQAADVDEPTQD